MILDYITGNCNAKIPCCKFNDVSHILYDVSFCICVISIVSNFASLSLIYISYVIPIKNQWFIRYSKRNIKDHLAITFGPSLSPSSWPSSSASHDLWLVGLSSSGQSSSSAKAFTPLDTICSQKTFLTWTAGQEPPLSSPPPSPEPSSPESSEDEEVEFEEQSDQGPVLQVG